MIQSRIPLILWLLLKSCYIETLIPLYAHTHICRMSTKKTVYIAPNLEIKSIWFIFIFPVEIIQITITRKNTVKWIMEIFFSFIFFIFNHTLLCTHYYSNETFFFDLKCRLKFFSYSTRSMSHVFFSFHIHCYFIFFRMNFFF